MGMNLTLTRRSTTRLPDPGAHGEVALACRGVTVRYGDRVVLEQVDLELRAGEVLALVGPNGAGKSTLVAVLSGDLAPAEGQVLLDGAPLGEWSTIEVALRRAVLLQQTAMSFPFTVLQAVRMGRSPWEAAGIDDVDGDRIVAESMARTDVVQFADRVFMSLSGGERARAALARVLAQDTHVLLLDEPTAALDIRHQEQVLTVAGRLAAEGRAVAVVMHDLGLAAAHADRVAVLSGGRILAEGPPGAVLTSELLSQVYECPIEVLRHPRTDALLVVPQR
jgi:iron complex transport system ATP-binding protein